VRPHARVLAGIDGRGAAGETADAWAGTNMMVTTITRILTVMSHVACTSGLIAMPQIFSDGSASLCLTHIVRRCQH
jgi:hypothetical protein